MSRRLPALAFAACLMCSSTAALAVPTPTASGLLVRTSSSVSIQRGGSENPVLEVAKSAYWGAVAGFVLGSAITLVDDGHSFAPMRWGIALGAFGGFGAGVYFVANRPVPSGLLEVRGGSLVPGAALAALESVAGGARVRVLSVKF